MFLDYLGNKYLIRTVSRFVPSDSNSELKCDLQTFFGLAELSNQTVVVVQNLYKKTVVFC